MAILAFTWNGVAFWLNFRRKFSQRKGIVGPDVNSPKMKHFKNFKISNLKLSAPAGADWHPHTKWPKIAAFQKPRFSVPEAASPPEKAKIWRFSKSPNFGQIWPKVLGPALPLVLGLKSTKNRQNWRFWPKLPTIRPISPFGEKLTLN